MDTRYHATSFIGLKGKRVVTLEAEGDRYLPSIRSWQCGDKMRELLVVPDERLRQKAEPVGDPTSIYIKELASYMLNKLGDLALGFAAPQFGEMLRLFVAKVQGVEVVLINPEITKRVGQHTLIEGCTSIPNRFFWVRRPKVVKVKGFKLDGSPVSLKGHDLLAQLLCHEIDHLDGVLIDKIGREVGEDYFRDYRIEFTDVGVVY